jgi:hypothetical protein
MMTSKVRLLGLTPVMLLPLWLRSRAIGMPLGVRR